MSEQESEKVEETELEKIKRENEELKLKLMNPPSDKPKKERKPFEWTAKRLEAFQKMREGLESKNELTKKIKEDKAKSEKDEIKKRVREIMNIEKQAKAVSQEIEEEASSESEVEVPKAKAKKEVAKVSKKKKNKAPPPPSSSEEEEEEEESSESEEEKVVTSVKKQQKARDTKAKTGKWQKQTPVFNASDRFILL